MDSTPRVLFVRDTSTDRWTIETPDFAQLRQALGPDAMNAFSRCFVHGDRLTSLIGFAFLSEERYGKDSPAFHRDLQTMVWFVVGTLRELAMSVRNLRSALATKDLLDTKSNSWVILSAFERRWEDDPAYREMRNTVAFHVDSEMTEKGLKALEHQERVVIVEGDGRPQRHTFLKLGLEALFMGSEMDATGLDTFMVNVGRDQAITETIQEAFIQALVSVGIYVHEEERGA